MWDLGNTSLKGVQRKVNSQQCAAKQDVVTEGIEGPPNVAMSVCDGEVWCAQVREHRMQPSLGPQLAAQSPACSALIEAQDLRRFADQKMSSFWTSQTEFFFSLMEGSQEGV